MFLVQSMAHIMEDETLLFEDKQILIVLYNQMLQKARCDMTESELADITGIDENKVKSRISVLREKEYLVGPNIAL